MKNYNINITALCERLGLGGLIGEAVPISGGLLHKMFDVKTEKGRFAVKALNPNIMERPAAFSNMVFGEETANRFSERIAVSCAKKIDGDFIHLIDGQYYFVYDFIEGQTVSAKNTEPIHTNKVGTVLAKIHKENIPAEKSEQETIDINWELYDKPNLPWSESFEAFLPELYMLTEKAREAFQSISGSKIVCHRDMDAKNILWQGNSPVVIDWESAGAEYPEKDFLETALYWSLNEDMSVRADNFTAFAEGYKAVLRLENRDWEQLLYICAANKLYWLEYSLKRSLQIECADKNEQEMGTEQALQTILEIKNFYGSFPQILELAKKL